MAYFYHFIKLFSIQITELLQKIESLEGESVAEVHQSRLELKIKELESKLELEQTTRGRMETQINRLKEAIEKLNSECDLLRSKELSSQELARKLQRQLRDLKEEHANAQQRETDSHSKKHELEKQLVICPEKYRLKKLIFFYVMSFRRKIVQLKDLRMKIRPITLANPN